MTTVQCTQGDTTLNLACAKYLASEIDERWMRLEYENRRATFDFETTEMQLECAGEAVSVSLRNDQEYVTQFLQAVHLHRLGGIDCMYELLRDSLKLTLRIRHAAKDSSVLRYSVRGLDREWLRSVVTPK